MTIAASSPAEAAALTDWRFTEGISVALGDSFARTEDGVTRR
jgi:hypothetical protein